MKKTANRSIKEQGFTIVELIIIIIVIGVLASIVLIGGGNYLKKTKDSSAKTSLVTARAALNQKYDKYGEFPKPSLPPSITIPDGFSYNTNGFDFCISGDIAGSTWHISKANGEPTEGSCSALAEMPDPSQGIELSLAISPIELSPLGNVPDMPGIFAAAAIVDGGEPPYEYDVTLNGSGFTRDPIEVDGQPVAGMYTIMHDETSTGFNVYAPNAMFAIPDTEEFHPDFDDKLILAISSNDFSPMCSVWTTDSITMPLKLTVTDSNNEQAEYPFTIGCAT